jgi:hypothetical protein
LPGPEYTRRPAGGIGKSIVNVGYRSTNFWTEITPDDNTVIPLAGGRALLRTLGIDGELLRSKGAKQVYAGHGPIRGMP